ncbi:MAG: PIN domain-containing protein [Dyadobacter sp.]|uniref:PIN domain-containing protein n=1 Tax=Dyadobacter sp. TaxID=1914288 RepID=UPI0032657DBC
MSLYLLDTNICVHLLKNEYGVKERIAHVGVTSCFLSEITLAELIFGIENSAPDRRKQNFERFKNLHALFDGRILPIGGALYEFAQQKATLRRRGRSVMDFDLLIGATAIVDDFVLVTRNISDFTDMEGIELENWIDNQ